MCHAQIKGVFEKSNHAWANYLDGNSNIVVTLGATHTCIFIPSCVLMHQACFPSFCRMPSSLNVRACTIFCTAMCNEQPHVCTCIYIGLGCHVNLCFCFCLFDDQYVHIHTYPRVYFHTCTLGRVHVLVFMYPSLRVLVCLFAYTFCKYKNNGSCKHAC